ncbi:hypothetical protein CsSME_00030508 [Camellia sinensis var. sinensis]
MYEVVGLRHRLQQRRRGIQAAAKESPGFQGSPGKPTGRREGEGVSGAPDLNLPEMEFIKWRSVGSGCRRIWRASINMERESRLRELNLPPQMIKVCVCDMC